MINHAGCLQIPVFSKPGDFLAAVEAGLAEAPADSLAALPELSMGGFEYEDKHRFAEATPEILDKLQTKAEENGISLAGTFWEREGDDYYNSLFLLGPELKAPLLLARKNHLFPLSREEKEFMPGGHPPKPVTHRGLKLGSAICFELRFPEVFRAQNTHSPDLFILSSQWPATRAEHLTTLVRARAIENQAFFLSCNAVGPSDLGPLAGQSQLISPWGEVLFQLDNQQATQFHSLELEELSRAAKHFQTRISPWHEVGFNAKGGVQG